jgi:hypothetical protein
MTFLMLFKLPNYRIPGYITIMTLFIIASMFSLKSSTNYKFSIIHILITLLPLVVSLVINTNKHFEKILDRKNANVSKLNTIQVITVILSMTQFILFYNSLNNTSSDFIYGSGIVAILNLFLNGLLWREVAFYVTDG